MYKGDNGVHYGLLQKLVLLSLECFAVLIPLLESTEKLCSSSIATNNIHSHYIACHPPRSAIATVEELPLSLISRDKDMILLEASRIVDKCIYIDAQNELNLVFVSVFPNSVEYE